MQPSFHPTALTIENILKDNNLWYERFEHTPIITSKEAEEVRNDYTIEQGVKALIVKVRLNKNVARFVMICVSGDKKFDSKKIQQILSIRKIRFATLEEISTITDGIVRGGVPPFGNLFKLEIIADKSIFNNEKIIFNAGDKRISIAMLSEDYAKIVKPLIADIS